MNKQDLKKLSLPELEWQAETLGINITGMNKTAIINAITQHDAPVRQGSRYETKTKLKTMRLAAELSQSQLANAAGLNVRSYQHYEQGSHPLHRAALDTLLKICLNLNCKLTDIIDDPDTIKLIKKYKGMGK